MVEEAQFTATKRAFGGLDEKLLLAKDRKLLPDVGEMLLQGRAEAEEVVHVDHYGPVERTRSPRDPCWCSDRGAGQRRVSRSEAPSHGGVHDAHEH